MLEIEVFIFVFINVNIDYLSDNQIISFGSKNKLFTFAQTIPDFRLNKKNISIRKHCFHNHICGDLWCGDLEEMEDYGIVKRAFLETILGLENGIPSNVTFNRFFFVKTSNF